MLGQVTVLCGLTLPGNALINIFGDAKFAGEVPDTQFPLGFSVATFRGLAEPGGCPRGILEHAKATHVHQANVHLCLGITSISQRVEQLQCHYVVATLDAVSPSVSGPAKAGARMTDVATDRRNCGHAEHKRLLMMHPIPLKFIRRIGPNTHLRCELSACVDSRNLRALRLRAFANPARLPGSIQQPADRVARLPGAYVRRSSGDRVSRA